MTIVTVDDLRVHLSMQEDEETDAVLEQKIGAAEDWVAGYIGQALADLDPLPAVVTEAVLRLAAELYENREASLVGVSAEILPFGVTDLLTPIRKWVF